LAAKGEGFLFFSRKMTDKILGKYDSVKSFAFSMAVFSGASILGPMIFLGGLGILADRLLSSKPMGVLIGLVFAFILTNYLLISKALHISKEIEKIKVSRKNPAVVDEEEDEKSSLI
jgi:F0F1-type ATP synthase assembly protein I